MKKYVVSFCELAEIIEIEFTEALTELLAYRKVLLSYGKRYSGETKKEWDNWIIKITSRTIEEFHNELTQGGLVASIKELPN